MRNKRTGKVHTGTTGRESEYPGGNTGVVPVKGFFVRLV